MRLNLFLFSTIFILSISYDIIRDLPYNIYHIEDMSLYEKNYIKEGNNFYIRFPYNTEKDIKFYLTIPKYITLFPIYFYEFTTYPNYNDIINTNFNAEIEFNNKEVMENIIYSYNIKKTEGKYLVLFFKNNEALNYISFYANTNSNISSILSKASIIDLYDSRSYDINPFIAEESYYFRLNITTSSKINLEIKTTAEKSDVPTYLLDLKCFSNEPTDDDLTNVDSTWKRSLYYSWSESTYYNYEYRTYKYKTEDEVKYCGIHINNKVTLDNFNISVSYTIITEFPIWVIIIFSIIGFIVLLLIARSCRRKSNLEKAEDGCRAMCCLFVCGAFLARSAQNDY